MLDDGAPKGALNYWKSSFLESLTDETIDAVVEQFSDALPPLNAALFEHMHGEATRVAPDATAFTHREEGHNFLITGVWQDPGETETNVAWVRRFFDELSPHFRDNRYVNYLGDDEGEVAPDAAYGQIYERLREVKRRYDPDNVFHLNQNIVP